MFNDLNIIRKLYTIILLILYSVFLDALKAQTGINVACQDGISGQTVCYKFETGEIQQLEGLSFTISFNSILLRPILPVNVTGSPLTGIGAANFNTARADNGYITFLWFDNPIDIPSGSVIFELCFELIGDPGQTAFIGVTSDILAIEVLQNDNGQTVEYPNFSFTPCDVQINASQLTLIAKYCDPSDSPPGSADGSIRFYATAGAPPYNYTITGPVNASGSLTENEEMTISNLPSGAYTILITDSNGATTSRSINLTGNDPIDFNLTGRNPSCFSTKNGFVEIVDLRGGLSPYTFEWSNNRYNLTLNDGLTNGTYTVTVTDVNGCSLSRAYTLDMDTLRVSVDVLSPATCINSRDGQVRFTALGGTPFPGNQYRFRFNNGPQQTLDNVVIRNDIRAGMNTVRVIDNAIPFPCNTTDITFDVPYIHDVDFDVIEIKNRTCYGTGFGSIRVRAITAPNHIYQLRNLTTGEIVLTGGVQGGVYINDELEPGDYELTASISGFSNCSNKFNFTISQPVEPLTVTLVNKMDPTCNGFDGSIEVVGNGGYGGYQYLWDNGSSDPIITGLNGGSFTVTVTDSEGCTAVFTENVSDGGDITIDAVVTKTISCAGGNDGIVGVNINLGNANFVWSNQAGNVVGNDRFAENLSSGWYYVTVTSSDCVKSDSVLLTDPPRMEFTAINEEVPECPQEDFFGSLGVSISGGLNPLFYEWTREGETEVLGTFSVLTNIRPGSYRVRVRDVNNCQIDTLLVLKSPEPIQLIVSDILPVRCFGSPTGSAVATASGGTVMSGNFTFLWSSSPEDGNSGTSSTASHLMAGTQWVLAFDSKCVSDTLFFEVPDATPISLSNTNVTTPDCSDSCNGTIQVNAAGGNSSSYDYAWPDIAANGPAVQDLCAGTYTVVVTDANDCVVSFDLNLIAPDELVVSLDTSATIELNCNTPLGTIAVSVSGGNSGGYSYSWVGTNSTNEIASGLNAGTYGVTVTDTKGCTGTFTYELSGPEAIQATVPQPQEPNCFGETTCVTVLNPSGGSGTNYTFTVNRGPRFQPGECVNVLAGTYIINVFDSEGCTVEYPLEISQPDPILLDLGNDIQVDLGDPTPPIDPLVVSVNPIAQYIWSPSIELECLTDNCSSIIITPDRDFTLRLDIVDEKGCIASDDIRIRVSDERRVYFPTIFSPVASQEKNRLFNIVLGKGTVEVEFLNIYDRLGNLIYQRNNFVPIENDPQAWDGRYGGTLLNPGVFTYIAKVSFTDGQERTYTGTITLLY